MKISDFKGLFKKSRAKFVSIENPFEDYYVITLKPTEELTWRPGEHGIFTLPGKSFRGQKFRAFSVASIPEEGVIIIGTRTRSPISNFKKDLIGLQKGEEVGVRGPFGWFTLKDETTPLVFVAGGVGIVPFRALMKQVESKPRPVEIIYSSSDAYLFEEEISQMVEKSDQFKLHKTKGREETKQKLEEMAKTYGKDAYYYVSGSQSFIKSVKEEIIHHSIPRNRILSDLFIGY
jgi:NAD(P)H-flavin reductase